MLTIKRKQASVGEILTEELLAPMGLTRAVTIPLAEPGDSYYRITRMAPTIALGWSSPW